MTPTNHPKNASFPRRLKFALQGLVNAFKKESSVKVQMTAALGVFLFCLWDRPSALWCAIFTLLVVAVLTLELINTALEAMMDRIHPEHHPEIGFAKDCLAGAVLIACIGSVVVFAIYIITKYAVN